MTTDPPPKPARPIAVTIAGWVLLFGALVNILFGLLFIYASGVITRNSDSIIILSDPGADRPLTVQGADLLDGAVDLVLGGGQLILTIGFWLVRRWAWVGAMSWQALKLLFQIASVFVGGGGLITILFACLLVFLLNQSEVRRAFKILPENESSSQPLRILDSN